MEIFQSKLLLPGQKLGYKWLSQGYIVQPRIPEIDVFFTGNDNWSFEMDIYTATLDGMNRAVMGYNYGGATPWIGLVFFVNDTIVLRNGGNSNSITGNPITTYILGKWAHIKIAKNSNVLELYVNDILLGTPAYRKPTENSNTPYYLGTHTAGIGTWLQAGTEMKNVIWKDKDGKIVWQDFLAENLPWYTFVGSFQETVL